MTWQMVKLKHCCNVVGGATPKREVPEYWNRKDVPWVTPKDVSNLSSPILDDAPEYISQKGFKSCSTHLLPKGSILLTSRAPIGNVAISGRDMCTNQGFKSLIPTDDADSTYLYYCMLAYSEKLQALGNGATFKEVSKKVVEEFEIPFPPLPEQKRIAAILDKADAIRRKRQQAIQLADEFLRAVFLELFGDPVANSKGWEVKKLKDLSTKILSGTTPNGGKENYVDKGIMFFRSQNVWKRKILLEDIAYIDEQTHKKMSNSSLKHKDILMTKTGRFNTENSSLGRASMFLGEDDSANINGHVYLIRLNSNVINEFVLYILTTNEYRDYIRSVCVGGIDKRQINKEHLEEFPIIQPSLEAQKDFSKCMRIVETMKEKAMRSLKEFDDLFNALSQKAFAGKL